MNVKKEEETTSYYRVKDFGGNDEIVFEVFGTPISIMRSVIHGGLAFYLAFPGSEKKGPFYVLARDEIEDALIRRGAQQDQSYMIRLTIPAYRYEEVRERLKDLSGIVLPIIPSLMSGEDKEKKANQ